MPGLYPLFAQLLFSDHDEVGRVAQRDLCDRVGFDTYRPGSKSRRTFSLSAIQIPLKRTRIRRRNGSTYNSLSGSGSGTRNRPIAPGDNGPCCQDNPIALPPDARDLQRHPSRAVSSTPAHFREPAPQAVRGYNESIRQSNQSYRCGTLPCGTTI